ncbi:MAG TPA: nuclear transport factor 2 family protein [Mycobacteriales bacterium]|jgi:hypothetical protein|nr:nuclear transport factor 2 family protein [Mycobacteriales bacterium]
MDDIGALREQVETLAARVQELEDRQQIADLVAQYGPTVDSGSAEATAGLWTEDGTFDVLDTILMQGREQIAGMVTGEGHQGLIKNGVAHVLTVPYIRQGGDQARGWSYALNIRYDADADRFWVARVSAVTWELARTDEGWRITHRVNANLDGAEPPRQMFRGMITDGLSR